LNAANPLSVVSPMEVTFMMKMSIPLNDSE